MAQGSRVISQNLVEKYRTRPWRPLFRKRSYLLERQVLPSLFWPARLRPCLTCAQTDALLFPSLVSTCSSVLPRRSFGFPPLFAAERLFWTFLGLPSSGGHPHPRQADNPPPTRRRTWKRSEGNALPCPAVSLHTVAAVGSLPASGPFTWDSSPSPRVAPSSKLQLQVPCDGGTHAVRLVWVPRTGEARYHRWGAFHRQTSILRDLERTSLESACRQGWSRLGGSGGTVLGPSPGFRWGPVVTLIPRLVDTSLQSLPPSSCNLLCTRLSDSCEVTVIGCQHPHSRMTSSASSFTSWKAPFSNEGEFWLRGGWEAFSASLSSLLCSSQIHQDLPPAPGLLPALSPLSRTLVLGLSCVLESPGNL